MPEIMSDTAQPPAAIRTDAQPKKSAASVLKPVIIAALIALIAGYM